MPYIARGCACQVISSLDSDWQHERLAKALEVHANTNKSLQMVTVRQLEQGADNVLLSKEVLDIF